YLDPFWTTVVEQNGTGHEAALITSPEYAMKRLLAAGFEKIYDLGPCFRNGEPWDGTHDPEFLLIEWYRRNADTEALMNDTEEMIRFVARAIESKIVTDTFPKFRRLTVRDAMKQYANMDLDAVLENRDALARVAREHHQTILETDTWDDLFFKIFLSEVEPHLGWNADHTKLQPTFLYQYPLSMAALARKDPQNPAYAMRVELYIGDLELANGFAELSDPEEQRKRFEEEQALRKNLGKKVWSVDERFLASLPNMGNAAGIAFGVDRLVMVLLGADSINDVVPFPARERFMRHEKALLKESEGR
ncbi:MAG TPA: EF-P lysine aminoacylase EpmA, partial [Patescibacteria group bacterium]|nr:EF-P lysine aminoacylase EpmA [Patescibacteria group bacterium]